MYENRVLDIEVTRLEDEKGTAPATLFLHHGRSGKYLHRCCSLKA
jgi:hypothetical protein